MRFIHTADWHLGRIFYGQHLTSDQHYLLQQLSSIIKDFAADALLVAGDIFDRAVPPPEAVALLNDFLSRVVLELKVPVIAIAGNHDSPDRLSFGSRLFREQGLFLFGDIRSGPGTVTLSDTSGPVTFTALPFAETALVRQLLNNPELHSHAAAMEALLKTVRPQLTGRNVLLGHAFVDEGTGSESERPITVGGAGTIPAQTFAGFDYVAMGHLHCAQQICDFPIYYSGSLMRYAFAETEHEKSVTAVEMDEKGICSCREISLTPKRQVRCITGTLQQLLQGPDDNAGKNDYLKVILEDQQAVLEPTQRLRQVYPNLLHLEWLGRNIDGTLQSERSDPRKRSDAELFAAFFQEVTAQPLAEEPARLFAQVVEQMQQQQRESNDNVTPPLASDSGAKFPS